MIEVQFVKYDPYLGKENTKTSLAATPEKARAKAAAIASVNKLPPSSIVEEKDEAGELVRVVISTQVPATDAAPDTMRDDDLSALRARIEVLEQLAGLRK